MLTEEIITIEKEDAQLEQEASLFSLVKEFSELSYYSPEKSTFKEKYNEEAIEFLEQNVPGLLEKFPNFEAEFDNQDLDDAIYEYIRDNAKENISLPKHLLIIDKWNGSRINKTLSLYKPFIGTNDILNVIRHSRQNIYWAFNYLMDVIKDGFLNDDRVTSLLYQVVLGENNDSLNAFKSLQNKLMEESEFDSRAYKDIKERISQFVFGYGALKCINLDFINKLPDEQQKAAYKKLCAAEVKEEEWYELDKILKPHGHRATNIGDSKSESFIEYLRKELEQTNDATWVTNLALSFRGGHNKTTGEIVSNALFRLKEGVKFTAFTHREHAQNIRHAKLIEYMLADCQLKAKEALGYNYGRYFGKKRSIEEVNWDFFVEHCEITFDCCYPIFHQMPIEKWQWLWEQPITNKAKRFILNNALTKIERSLNDDSSMAEQLKDCFNKWLQSNIESFDRKNYLHLNVGYSEMEGIYTALYMWDVYTPNIKTQYVREINESLGYMNSDHPKTLELLGLLCNHNLKDLMRYRDNRLEVLTCLSDDSFEQLLENIELIEKSNASIKYLSKGLANVSCKLIDNSGLYVHAKKPVRDSAQWSLSLTNDPEATNVINELLGNKKAKLTDVQISHYLDKLESNGDSIRTNPLETDNLHAYCESKINKTNIKKLQRLWSPDLGEAWGENSEILQYALIVLAQNEWGGVPRITRLCFETINPQQRKAIATKVIEAWAKGEGHKSDFWVLDLLTEYSDENTIPMLQKLVVDWHKKYRLRAAQVVTVLGVMDTTMALNICDEFYKKSKYSWDVREAAKDALKAAAKRRGIPLSELYDELVPTFGLSKEGLKLNTGTRNFTVNLQASLDLTVTDDETGKTYKSLPKAKKDDDPELRAAADCQYKLLKKNVKPMIKSLKDRFIESFDIGKSWAAPRWKMLFLEHPIMSLVGQAFIWEHNLDGKKAYFRISEDLSLIDADDEEVNFEDSEIMLMHPAETPKEICDAWREHMSDYDIESFIDQLGANDLSDIAIDWESNTLDIFNKTDALYGKFKRLMANNNYVVGDGDGSWIFDYYRQYTNAPWMVEVNMEECRSYFSFDEAVTFGKINFVKKKDSQALRNVPKRLISAVVSLIQEIQK
ncbi:DUF4132 domain-containing protein [Pleionea mediterranea]|uniref:Uncharacterized protein DUF4132 n=1 Tax=Pleionea mediterranea TaxID=523701 RepID=A0A316FU36_9GAMM|nr:DUF4132 domain-containing protein [Pleionea mediterranea]PWK51782.1 uncharacterized protein DUF4132 [Pleionea mediterranea]